jgi:prepilin-type N-terminal cleavage/methylation domain-containing protein
MRRRGFTLLEVMVALALLVMASGAVIWKTRNAIENKQFDTDVSRMQVQLASCYHLAINTHADWKVEALQKGNSLLVQVSCSEDALVSFQPKTISLSSCTLFFEGVKAEQFVVYFSSTGKVVPAGILQLVHRSSDRHQELFIPELFHQKETALKKGPIHPDDG